MEPVQKIPYRKENRLNPPSLSELHIHGSIGDQMETFFHERIFSDYARNTIYAETEEQFRIVDDDKSCIGMWRGEFWGKWVISACRAARYEHDDDMKEFLHAAAHRMLSLMREDGYLGTYRDPENYFACDPARALAEEGHESNWNWNIWCRKYTLWGLLECYDLTGDETILAGAARTADQLISMLQKNGVRIGDTGTFCGMPSCSILKPMLLLYERTGVQRYLDFACGIADDWERPDGKQPNLIANALSGKPVHTWYPHPEKWAKAYEMMSCFD
ncbi:MAG: glycoside hydrolase family 127 protein, partial [Clostridia bacterium]|nr:glycoside hydrolase family 127 protein [Clostridia bacterium]